MSFWALAVFPGLFNPWKRFCQFSSTRMNTAQAIMSNKNHIRLHLLTGPQGQCHCLQRGARHGDGDLDWTGSQIMFQQDSTPFYVTQKWLAKNFPDNVTTNMWLPSHFDLNLLDYYAWDTA